MVGAMLSADSAWCSMKIRVLFSCLVALCLSGCGYARFIRVPHHYQDWGYDPPHLLRDEYMAGTAKRVITPPDASVWLAGFNFNRPATGVHDDIETRALALSDGSGRIYIFVTADVIGLFHDDVEKLRNKIHIPGVEVFVLSSHNHQGPDTMGLWGPGIRRQHFKLPLGSGRNENYIDWMIEMMAQASMEATLRLEPVKIDLGSTTIDDMCDNKREQQFFDSELSVLSFWNYAHTKRVAVLANYGCHPETVENDNQLLTADFVGAFRNRIDTLWHTTSFFVNGSLGAMVSPAFEWKHGSFAGRETFGAKLASYTQTSDRESVSIHTTFPIAHASETIRIPLENKMFLLAGLLGAMPLRGILCTGAITTETHVFRIGDVTIMMVPGEISPELGLELKKLGGPRTQVWSLANDEIGYIIAPEKYSWDMYRYERGKSVGPQAWPIIRDSIRRELSSLDQ